MDSGCASHATGTELMTLAEQSPTTIASLANSLEITEPNDCERHTPAPDASFMRPTNRMDLHEQQGRLRLPFVVGR